jgi:thiol-disulfide isomerase/thioredoxin
MAVTQERFDQGMTYGQYKAQMTRSADRFDANEKNLQLTDAQLAPFRALPKALNVLVIGEDWCGDVIANMPIVGRIANETGKLNVRVFLRDQNLDLTDQFLKEGKYRSIPIVVFLDDSFDEIGRFIERPASVTELRAQKRLEVFAQHPEFGSPDAPIDQLPEDVRTNLQAELAATREETIPFANAEVVRELTGIVAKAPARA